VQKKEVKRLYATKYTGFNITHFTEYLNEKEGVSISRESVRKILRENNLYLKKPKKQLRHRTKREPMPKEGY
jgi:transposase